MRGKCTKERRDKDRTGGWQDKLKDKREMRRDKRPKRTEKEAQ